MKKKIMVTLACTGLFFFGVSCNNSSKNQNSENMETITNKNNNPIFPQGERGSSEWFTGEVYVQGLVSPDQMEGLYNIGQVSFMAGGRTLWHTHPIGQTLLVTEGEGWYQERGKPAQKLIKGSIVPIPKDVEHWHGASKDHKFVHIAITNMKDGSNVTWMAPVTDEEYNSVD